MSLTTKELLLIQDNIKMAQNSISFMQGCTELFQDPQAKSLCEDIATEHKDDLQILMKHINSATIQ